MKCWLFLCTIYVLSHYTDEHLVVLDKHTKPNAADKLNPSSIEEGQENTSGGNSEDGEQGPSTNEEDLNANNELQEGSNDSESASDGDKTLKQFIDFDKDNEHEKARKVRNWMRWASEISAGNPVEIIGTNPHVYQPDAYPDLNRRFVLQYPYSEAVKQVDQNIEVAPGSKEIVPIEAPEELVTLVAKESAMRVASRPQSPDEAIPTKKLLRSGAYWNDVWKEEVNPKAAMRTSNDRTLGVIKAKIMPGNEFYDVISKMKESSPRLLYIINDKNDDDNN